MKTWQGYLATSTLLLWIRLEFFGFETTFKKVDSKGPSLSWEDYGGTSQCPEISKKFEIAFAPFEVAPSYCTCTPVDVWWARAHGTRFERVADAELIRTGSLANSPTRKQHLLKRKKEKKTL